MEPTHTDINHEPERDGLEDHQHWVWLAGANPPHWEIFGTGLLLDEEQSR